MNQFGCASHLAEYLLFSAHLEISSVDRWTDNKDGSYGVSVDIFGGLSSSFDNRMNGKIQPISLQFHLLNNSEWSVLVGDLYGQN